ncbi:hypothetical protein BIZ37_11100 [Photobacterium sp. BZF1]|uniref:hypothetical protein n=1 Tax=Photobacterium sp. BZF1 TaxID=1904457 RepID=UPI001653D308|nr:hypothetical protein [Photobacterium sp. BZF1]MBC7003108.1 hypothetical protein [Photobacterium sp. BZF1]
MSIQSLEFCAPFFKATLIENEALYRVSNNSILLNLSDTPIKANTQSIAFYESKIINNIELQNIERIVLIEGFDAHPNEAKLFENIKQTWALAYDVRGEERLKGVPFWMSPKDTLGNIKFSMYFAGRVPLQVGLHQTHVGFNNLKEIHTQIVGYGKMQQCFEKDIKTLYLEDTLAPGASHKPMYDESGSYPWHQYETITQGVFMAIEMEMSPSQLTEAQQALLATQ